jgi:hypothetical protein
MTVKLITASKEKEYKMSSTWFRKVYAIKTDIEHGSDQYRYTRTGYILIAETAESNVVDDNGGHPYNAHIISSGEYDNVLKDVCESAYYFDLGMNKWKPHSKDSAGFIRICKKALEAATYADKLPYNVTGYLMFLYKGNPAHEQIRRLFRGVPNASVKTFYGSKVLVTDDVKTFISAKGLINRIFRDYLDQQTDYSKFGDWWVGCATDYRSTWSGLGVPDSFSPSFKLTTSEILDIAKEFLEGKGFTVGFKSGSGKDRLLEFSGTTKNSWGVSYDSEGYIMVGGENTIVYSVSTVFDKKKKLSDNGTYKLDGSVDDVEDIITRIVAPHPEKL